MDLKFTEENGGKTLNLAITGSIDTNTAPQLEKELQKRYASTSELIMDFAGVDYISSAGLRVLIGASKVMDAKGSLKLINVNDDVREVFEMTGFDELLNIE